MTVAIAKNAGGVAFLVHNVARNSAGVLTTVSNFAEDSSANPFLIFTDTVVLTPPPTGQIFEAEDERYFWA
jgi:branched-subunit amino acid aminotransferase/4-amino-4-deoxychorismate lyase